METDNSLGGLGDAQPVAFAPQVVSFHDSTSADVTVVAVVDDIAVSVLAVVVAVAAIEYVIATFICVAAIVAVMTSNKFNLLTYRFPLFPVTAAHLADAKTIKVALPVAIAHPKSAVPFLDNVFDLFVRLFGEFIFNRVCPQVAIVAPVSVPLESGPRRVPDLDEFHPITQDYGIEQSVRVIFYETRR